MKKLIASLLLVTFLLSCLGAAALAEGEVYRRDDYSYTYMRNGNLKLVKYHGSAGTVNIPSSIDGHDIECIGAYAFEACRASKITIPGTVKWIESAAFYSCVNLQKITIPNNVLIIDGNPFPACTSLVNITVDPKHPTLRVTTDGALYSMKTKTLLCYPCTKADTTFSVLPGTKAIGDYAFYNCERLVSIDLPDSVTRIGLGTFAVCKSLRSISMPDALLSIGTSAFLGSGILSITIPDGVTRIENSTFASCMSLRSVDLPQNLVYIDGFAFTNCGALTEIRAYENLETIGDGAFSDCPSLRNVYLPDSVRAIGDEAFEDCSPQLYLHLGEYTYAELYARIWDISFTYDNSNDFLSY